MKKETKKIKKGIRKKMNKIRSNSVERTLFKKVIISMMPLNNQCVWDKKLKLLCYKKWSSDENL